MFFLLHEGDVTSHATSEYSCNQVIQSDPFFSAYFGVSPITFPKGHKKTIPQSPWFVKSVFLDFAVAFLEAFSLVPSG